MLDNLFCVTDVTYYIYHCCIICPHSIIQIHSYILADHSNLNAEVFTLAQKQALDLLRWGKQPATVHIVAKIFLNLHQLHISRNFCIQNSILGQVWPTKVFLQILTLFSGFYNEIWYVFVAIVCHFGLFQTVLPFFDSIWNSICFWQIHEIFFIFKFDFIKNLTPTYLVSMTSFVSINEDLISLLRCLSCVSQCPKVIQVR